MQDEISKSILREDINLSRNAYLNKLNINNHIPNKVEIRQYRPDMGKYKYNIMPSWWGWMTFYRLIYTKVNHFFPFPTTVTFEPDLLLMWDFPLLDFGGSSVFLPFFGSWLNYCISTSIGFIFSFFLFS